MMLRAFMAVTSVQYPSSTTLGSQAAGTEADQTYPNLRGSVSWAVNMTGLGAPGGTQLGFMMI